MKNKKHSIILALVAPLAAICHANATELQWSCNWPEARSQPFSLYHGETATFAPSFRINGETATNIVITAAYVQTNGMGDVWWPLDNATFHPTNDVGAASYRFFVQATTVDGRAASGLIYRANGTLRMLDSPGFTPSAISLPTRTLDFAATAILNPPWPAEIQSLSNTLAQAIADAAPADYDTVSSLAHSALQSYTETDPTIYSWARAASKPSYSANEIFSAATNWIGVQGNAGRIIKILAQTIGGVITGGYQVTSSTLNDNNMTTYAYNGVAVKRNGTNQDYLWDTAATNGIVRRSDIAQATNAIASATSAQMAELRSDIADEITIRLASTNACISVSNGVTRIYEVNGANRTLKWEWNAALTNQLNSLAAQMPNKIEDASSWASYAASGLANPFPGAVTLDRGSTYFGSTNVVWTARDGFAVMTAHMPAAAGGNASQFRIGTDADDWFGLEVTASYLIDAHADSFAVASASGGTKTATITTDYDASYPSSPPVVYYTATLAEPFAQLNTGVSWAHNASSHVSTCTIQGLTAPSGFFFLKKWAAGGAIMRSTLPILPEGYRVEKNGSYVGTVQPDSIITITTGGKTYRLVAEEVQ